MRFSKTYIVLTFILFTTNVFAQFVWTKADSPYHINSDTLVQSLTIEPGVVVLFDGDYSFTVEGTLTALGSKKDSIIFRRDESNPTGWQGIIIAASSQNTEFSYCVIEKASNFGIKFEGSNTSLSNCTIKNNGGHGVYATSSANPLLSNCVIKNNLENGINTNGGNITLKNCIVANNDQGGIFVLHTGDTLNSINSVIADNNGPGIFSSAATLTLENSILYNNQTPSSNSGGTSTINYSNFAEENWLSGYSGTGNIFDPPQFLEDTTYTLSPNSPCIDSGNPDPVYNDVCFPPSLGSSRNDIGAYGGPEGCKWFMQLYVTPLSINFQHVTLGDSAEAELTVKNYRPTDLNVNALNLNGLNPENFSIDMTSFSLSAFDSLKLNVVFTPDEERTYNASLNIISEGGEESVDLVGRGVIPDIFVSPSSLSFSNIFVGDSSTLELAIFNTDLGTLKINSMNNNNPVYTLFSDTPPLFIPSLISDTVSVMFKPDSGKTFSDTLYIVSNDPTPEENPLKIPLRGTGLAPRISVAAQTLDFGDVYVKENSVVNLKLENKGNYDLLINSKTMSGADSTLFFIFDEHEEDTVLAGSSDSISIQFSPLSLGNKTASLILICNDPYDSLLSIPVMGNGLAAVLTVNHDTLDFGSVLLDSSATSNLIISNEGNIDLIIDEPLILGQDSLSFNVLNGAQSILIPPGASPDTTIIRFLPRSRGEKTAILKLFTNDPYNDSLLIPLAGKGVLPEIEVNTAPLDFDSVYVTRDSILNVAVSNLGDGELRIQSAITGEDSTEFAITSTEILLIPPDSSPGLISILFNPKSAGNKSANLSILSNDPDELNLTIPLAGTGVFPDAPLISVDPDSLSFFEIFVYDHTEQTILISNPGKEELIVFSTEIIGEEANQFSILEGGGNFTIPTEDRDTLKLGFDPLSVGQKNAYLRIISNAFLEDTLMIPLHGTGIIDSTDANIVFDTSSIALSLDSIYTIVVQIQDSETSIQSAKLFINKGGELIFRELTLDKANEDIWSTVIPAYEVTEKGVQYYFEAYHGGNTARYPKLGSLDPGYLSVHIPHFAFPFATLENKYQMLSLPINTNFQTLADLFSDDLGTYDSTQYRLFNWDNIENQFIELNDLNTYLPVGEANWLITKSPKNLDIENGESVRSDTDFKIILHSGWNMIANPFAFPVAWEEINSQSIQGQALYYYQGNQWELSQNLIPFRGYAIKARNDTVLSIPPIEADGILSKPNNVPLDASEWQIKITAQKGEFYDQYNYAGIRHNAKDEWDWFDLPEPPTLGNAVSLYFWNADDQARFTGDFRTPGAEGYAYDFTVSSNFSGQTSLDFSAYNLPQNFDWIVISPVLNVQYQDKKIITNKNESHYRLLVGTEEFLTPMLDSYPKVPKQFRLYQNYPNPFNPETQIQYQLPKATNISIEIFDIIGRNVMTMMHDQYKEPGFHDITWNGTDNFNRKVASGIYILYLRSDLYNKAIKMILQK